MKLSGVISIILTVLVLISGVIFAWPDVYENISASFLGLFDFFKLTPKEQGLGHLKVTPQFGVYSTVWTARSKKMEDLINLADKTEINSIVIDVKDSGTYLDENLKNLVLKLREKKIYSIARIILFQDDSQTKIHPDWYFKRENGSIWADNRNWHWLNPSNRETWEYNLAIAKRAVDYGFDELNFDYVRFPAFAKDDDVVGGDIYPKNKIINDFAFYLTSELKKYDSGITLSIDLFAYNMLQNDDLKIGQKFTDLYRYFDYICPMIYPSHYISGNFGFGNPADHPYEVVLGTIEKGKDQLREISAIEAGTTTPSLVEPVFKNKLKKLRPWLQDFNIGAIYNGEMIRREKQAVYDAGLTSGWLLWNPRNVYTESGLDLNK